MTIILVVVRELDADGRELTRTERRFRDVPGEPKQMEEYVLEVRKKKPNALIHFVNCTRPTPPHADFVQTKNYWWCPYCAKGRTFKYNEPLDVLRCEICGMTHLNFYVRQYNHVPDRITP